MIVYLMKQKDHCYNKRRKNQRIRDMQGDLVSNLGSTGYFLLEQEEKIITHLKETAELNARLKGTGLNRALMNERKGSINKIELFQETKN